MKKITTIFILLAILTSQCLGQNDNENQKKFIEQFVKSLLDEKVQNEEIISRFLLSDSLTVNKKELLIEHLTYVRTELKNRKIEIKNLLIQEYKVAPEKFKTIIISEDKISNAYLVLFKNENIIPILIEKSRIASFSTLNKSGRSYFMIL